MKELGHHQILQLIMPFTQHYSFPLRKKMLYLCIFLLLVAPADSRLNLARDSNIDVKLEGNVKPKQAICSETPSPKTKVDFPESIAGRSVASSFDMYTGYINVTDAPDYLFYWFFGTQNGDESAPLVIWTNGGPGCSSMEGASTENTPLSLFDIKEACSSGECDYTGQLSTNPYGWNARANVLYIDQPRFVGFSYGYGDFVTSSIDAGTDFVTCLLYTSPSPRDATLSRMPSSA